MTLLNARQTYFFKYQRSRRSNQPAYEVDDAMSQRAADQLHQDRVVWPLRISLPVGSIHDERGTVRDTEKQEPGYKP